MKVIFATGGTGGHLFPAVDVAVRLKKRNYDVLFVGPIHVARQMLDRNGLVFEYINVSGFVSKGIAQKIQALWRMIGAFFKSIEILRRYKPDVVCGFGSYASFAVVAAARCLNIPVLIHEQNVVPGKANLYLSKCAQKVAVSFKETEKYFSGRKVVLTGCPSHVPLKDVSRDQACEYLGVDKKKFIVCVLGGSQGSSFLNQLGLETFKLLKGTLEFAVIHICGKKDYEFLKKQYEQIDVECALFEFLEDIEYVYHAADLIISRAGAVTVTEIAQFKKRAIIVPYPHAGNHQAQNAQAITEFTQIDIVNQSEATIENLKEKIIGMKNMPLLDRNKTSGIIDPGENLLNEIVSFF